MRPSVALNANITPANIAREVTYLNGTGRESFERPYGLAWLLQLGAELRESKSPEAAALSSALKPLEAAVINAWCIWCITSAVVMTLVFLASLPELRGART